jgi:hypothetical protein
MAAATYGRLAEVVAAHGGRDLPDPGLLAAARTCVALRRVLGPQRERVAQLRERPDPRERHFPCVRPDSGSAAGSGSDPPVLSGSGPMGFDSGRRLSDTASSQAPRTGPQEDRP